MRITQISIEYINNYTQNKREHQRCNAKSNYENKISEGDVLLIHDERNPRTQWNLGFADKINPSRDNKVFVRCYCEIHEKWNNISSI